MRENRLLILGVVFLISLLVISSFKLDSAYSQGEVGLNWLSSSYDDDNTGFNPQSVITKDNVHKLQLQWIHRLPRNPFEMKLVSAEELEGENGHEGEHGQEDGMFVIGLEKSEGIHANPLVINGIVYVLTSFGTLEAISSTNGAVIWSFEVNVTEALEKPWIINRGIQRSITYYRENIYFQSIDCTIYGFEATTGELTVKIADTCKDIPDNIGKYYGEEAPIFYNDIMMVTGAAGFGQGRGYVSAYDLTTGELLWRWFSSPPMVYGATLDTEWEKGNIQPYPNDWVGDNNNTVGAGAAVRTIGVIDEEEGVVFFGTGPPVARTLAYHGHPPIEEIPGPNLYSNCIVALDINTGELLWYYQIDPHDAHRQGIYASLILAEINVGGADRKVIMVPSFQGFVYVLDAETGQLIYEPVSIGAHLYLHNENKGNEADMTINQDDLPKTPEGTIAYCPGSEGGVSAPMAYAYGKIFLAAQNDCFELREVVREDEVFWATSSYRSTSQNSSIYAIDASNGKLVWKYDIPYLYWFAGITVSGGVIYALDQPGHLYMIDADNGELLKSVKLDFSGDAGVSLGAAANGKMMLFMAVGTSELVMPTEGMVLAFALPEETQEDDSMVMMTYIGIAVSAISVLILILLLLKKR